MRNYHHMWHGKTLQVSHSREKKACLYYHPTLFQSSMHAIREKSIKIRKDEAKNLVSVDFMLANYKIYQLKKFKITYFLNSVNFLCSNNNHSDDNKSPSHNKTKIYRKKIKKYKRPHQIINKTKTIKLLRHRRPG